ncbi:MULTISPECIES: NAD-dependent epimerase/dehydratase family protein [unclassified Campylobacter]|uniref:NAD-dependent epimerase/dehydratase family protein n=1 Tax=unclassified Campylobacter TaxID=2593542 RepID=UPI001237FF6E|nr:MULTISPECIES: NAD-dependent epimerase/dehydratase family protein [unclassified Campylobacter]KAA6224825.1 NAD-dependent epimerase/dehydratase family protein [Campylobacter sp. LR286c]KAA6227973.1 NAD-dependent epimerase/dehydratase family protein [Campylobacter sp. LR196d]KAA6234389.1 NAD-dependent epimerase/dehydratase family protein [Campylobacter sp. LR264d]
MKTIFLTGGRGMVGQNILKCEFAKNYKILAPSKYELNLLDKGAIDSFLKANKIDYVIHAAGLVGGIAANVANPVKFLVHNAYMGLNLITSCFENNIKNFLNLASSCMYPKDFNGLLKENLILSASLEPTNEGYALAKILNTRLCEYINKEDKNKTYKTLIPCNLYGKFDKFDKNAHLIPAIIAKIHFAKSNDLNIVEIWGDGSAKREFMYASDLAKICFFSLENFNNLPNNLNVGTGKDYSILQYYKIVARVLGYKGEFSFDLTKPVGMKQKLLDISKLKALGFDTYTNLERGIMQTYEYYKSTLTGGD